MTLSLSKGVKNAVDTGLAIAGAVCGWLVTNAASLPPHYQVAGGIVGLAGGYAVSDALTYVDTGALPVEQLPVQLKAVWPSLSPLVKAEVAKLPTQSEVGVANLAIAQLDAWAKGA